MEKREQEDLEAMKEAIQEDQTNKEALNQLFQEHLAQKEIINQLAKERHELERSYEAKFEPIRANITQVLTEKPVESFWLNSMKNHGLLADFITEKDELLLKFLTNIKAYRHADDLGFTLEFYFATNPYITNQTLTKRFFMKSESVATKIEGTQIQWTSENFTQKQVKKKQKHKKSQQTRTVTKTVKAESFFNFFESCDFSETDPEQEEEQIDQVEEDIEIGQEILEELIPFVLPYYLGLREADQYPKDIDMDEFEDEEDSENEERKRGGGRKKGGKKGGAGPPDASGDQKAECNQQ